MSTYVVIKLWDWRRMIVPLSYFMEKPFQNWTRETASLIGTVFVYVDYTVPVEEVRQAVYQIAHESKLWDRNVINLQVTEAKANTVELRILASGRNSPEVLRSSLRDPREDHRLSAARTSACPAPRASGAILARHAIIHARTTMRTKTSTEQKPPARMATAGMLRSRGNRGDNDIATDLQLNS